MKIEYNKGYIKIYNGTDKEHKYEIKVNGNLLDKGIIKCKETKNIKAIANPRIRISWTAKIDVFIDNELVSGKIIKSSEL